jgi:hypothetical protein
MWEQAFSSKTLQVFDEFQDAKPDQRLGDRQSAHRVRVLCSLVRNIDVPSFDCLDVANVL